MPGFVFSYYRKNSRMRLRLIQATNRTGRSPGKRQRHRGKLKNSRMRLRLIRATNRTGRSPGKRQRHRGKLKNSRMRLRLIRATKRTGRSPGKRQRHRGKLRNTYADTQSDTASPLPDHRAWKSGESGGRNPDRCPSPCRKRPAAVRLPVKCSSPRL